MKDDIDNDKLDQFDSSADMDTPNIPGETEPDTSNDKDSQTMPYGDSSSDASRPDSPDQTTDHNMPDPISDFSSTSTMDSDSSVDDTPYDSSSTIMPDFVAPAPVANTKKSKRSKIILGFMIFVLLLALGGFVYWYYYMQPAPDTDTTTPVATEPKSKADTGLSYSDVIKDMNSDMPGLLAETFPKAKTSTLDSIDSPIFKPAGENFYVGASGDNLSLLVQTDGDKQYSYDKDGLDVNKKYATDNKAIIDVATKYLTDNGFQEAQTANTDVLRAGSVYTNDVTACGVAVNEDPVTVTCTELANYTNDRKTLAPMYTALKADEDNINANTVLGLMSTKTNYETGYQNATIGVSSAEAAAGGFAGLLYKMISDNQWMYFTGAQNTLACNQYNSDALKAAFYGEPCGNGKLVGADS